MLINRKRALEIGTELGTKLLEIRAELPSVYASELSDALRDASRRKDALSLSRSARALEDVAQPREVECLTAPTAYRIQELDSDGTVVRAHLETCGRGIRRYLDILGIPEGRIPSVRLPGETDDDSPSAAEAISARQLRARSASSQAVITARKATETEHALAPRIRAQGPARAFIPQLPKGGVTYRTEAQIMELGRGTVEPTSLDLTHDLRDHVNQCNQGPLGALTSPAPRPIPEAKPPARRGKRARRGGKSKLVAKAAESRLVKLL